MQGPFLSPSRSGRARTSPSAKYLLDGTRSDLRGWEWDYLKHLCRSEQITLRGFAAQSIRVSLHEDGRHVACNAAATK